MLWSTIGAAFVRSHLLPWSGLRVWILKRFGASIGQSVRIRPGVQITAPWRLVIGNRCRIKENVWIDNVAAVTLEDRVYLAQGAYLCTETCDWGSHPPAVKAFPIYIEAGSCIAPNAVVGPGIVVGKGAILCIGSVACSSLLPLGIYAGNPATLVKSRCITPRTLPKP